MLSEPVNLILTPLFFQFCFLTAYVGPGIAAGVVAVIFGVLFSMLLALFTVLYYPIKRIYKRWKKKQPEAYDVSSEA